jgi:hypothetical protein
VIYFYLEDLIVHQVYKDVNTKNKYVQVVLMCKKNGILYVYETTSKDGCKRR